MKKLVHDSGGKVVDAGLDYLRVTADHSAPRLTDVLAHVRERQAHYEREGYRRSELTDKGGHSGQTCGGWRWGEHPTTKRMLLEASSTDSKQLLELLKHFRLECRGTRIDCQITYERKGFNPRWQFEIFEVLRAAERRRGVGEGIRANIEDQPKTGSTLEIYSRSGRRCIRHYDKAAEQRHTIPMGTCRAEVEWKRDMARTMLPRLMNATDHVLFGLDAVVSEHHRLGIEPNYDWKGQPMELSVKRRPSDEQVWTDWFIATACPGLKRLTDPDCIERCITAVLESLNPSEKTAKPTVGSFLSPPEPPPARTQEQQEAWQFEKEIIDAAHNAQEFERKKTVRKSRKTKDAPQEEE